MAAPARRVAQLDVAAAAGGGNAELSRRNRNAVSVGLSVWLSFFSRLDFFITFVCYENEIQPNDRRNDNGGKESKIVRGK